MRGTFRTSIGLRSAHVTVRIDAAHLGQPEAQQGLEITLYAPFAAAANKLGEESQYFAWSTARAIDPHGSGRVHSAELINVLGLGWSRRQILRILDDERLDRWMEPDGDTFRIVGKDAISDGFEVEVPTAEQGRTFDLADLNTRSRRTAALVAVVLASSGPRSLAYVQRFCGVDRNTIYAWKKDPYIANRILRAHAEWAVE